MLSIFFLVQRIAICPIHNIYIYISPSVFSSNSIANRSIHNIYIYISCQSSF